MLVSIGIHADGVIEIDRIGMHQRHIIGHIGQHIIGDLYAVSFFHHDAGRFADNRVDQIRQVAGGDHGGVVVIFGARRGLQEIEGDPLFFRAPATAKRVLNRRVLGVIAIILRGGAGIDPPVKGGFRRCTLAGGAADVAVIDLHAYQHDHYSDHQGNPLCANGHGFDLLSRMD